MFLPADGKPCRGNTRWLHFVQHFAWKNVRKDPDSKTSRTTRQTSRIIKISSTIFWQFSASEDVDCHSHLIYTVYIILNEMYTYTNWTSYIKIYKLKICLQDTAPQVPLGSLRCVVVPSHGLDRCYYPVSHSLHCGFLGRYHHRSPQTELYIDHM